MVEVTPEMRLARQCAAKYWQTGDPGDEYAARMILSGEWDGEAYVQAALAAIKEVTAASEARIAELEGAIQMVLDRGYVSSSIEEERGDHALLTTLLALKGPTDAK